MEKAIREFPAMLRAPRSPVHVVNFHSNLAISMIRASCTEGHDATIVIDRKIIQRLTYHTSHNGEIVIGIDFIARYHHANHHFQTPA
jgi:hypothetical protein